MLMLLATPTLASSAQDNTDVLRVDAESVVGSVSPLVYGANFGPLKTIPPDLIEAAQNSNLRFLRFPGGR